MESAERGAEQDDGPKFAILGEEALAVKAWSLLGGFNLAGLPIVAEILGITDIESLLYRFRGINAYINRPIERES